MANVQGYVPLSLAIKLQGWSICTVQVSYTNARSLVTPATHNEWYTTSDGRIICGSLWKQHQNKSKLLFNSVIMLMARVQVYCRRNQIRINKHLIFYSIYQLLESKHVFPSLSSSSYVMLFIQKFQPQFPAKSLFEKSIGHSSCSVYTHIDIHTHVNCRESLRVWKFLH